MLSFFKGIGLKLLAIGGAIIALYAAYQKRRADSATDVAVKAQRKADQAEARYQAHIRKQERRAELHKEQAERRRQIQRDRKDGKRGHFNKQWIVACLAVLLTGCCGTEYVTEPLPECSPRPVLPVADEGEQATIEDLPQPVYDLLVERETRLKEYAEDLEINCRRPAE